MDAIKRYFWHREYEAIIASPKENVRKSLGHGDTGFEEGDETHRQRFPLSKERILIAVLTFCNVILFGLFIAAAQGHLSWRVGAIDGYHNRDTNSDIKRTMGYSPILDLYDLKQASKTFNGALRDNSSIWRQPPSPQVDAAWDYISTEGCELITVSEEDVVKSGKDPSISLQAPSSWGEGEGAYIAQIEVFHQIHCLNELRKEMHYDYYYKTARTELHRSHKAHCLHMLLQSLMCTADVGIVTHNWVHNENIPEPKTRLMPDFNVVKKCANFDGLLDWARKKAVKDMHKKWPDLRYVPGMKIVKGDGYAEGS